MEELASCSEPVIIDSDSRLEELENFINGGRVLVLTSKSVSRLPNFLRLCNSFAHSELFIVKNVEPNPTPESIDTLFQELRDFKPSKIVAFGGGSVIDSSKLLKARFENPHAASTLHLMDIEEFCQSEIVLMAVPTTAGTGSEVTQFATLWTGMGGGKESIESLTIRPNVVLLDASSIPNASKAQILNSGLDAISHCTETIWNRFKTKNSEEYAIAGLRKMLNALPRVLSGEYSMSDCADLQNGALLAGRAISINRTAIAHSISYSLTAYLGVPHGLACSFMIPTIYKCLYVDLPSTKDTKEILEETVTYLDSLRLPESVLNYGRLDEIVETATSISNKSRMENFCVDSDDFKILNLLTEAFAVK